MVTFFPSVFCRRFRTLYYVAFFGIKRMPVVSVDVATPPLRMATLIRGVVSPKESLEMLGFIFGAPVGRFPVRHNLQCHAQRQHHPRMPMSLPLQLEVCLARTSLRVLSYQVLEYKSCFTYYHYKWVFKTTEILKMQILKINISKRSSSQKNSR